MTGEAPLLGRQPLFGSEPLPPLDLSEDFNARIEGMTDWDRHVAGVMGQETFSRWLQESIADSEYGIPMSDEMLEAHASAYRQALGEKERDPGITVGARVGALPAAAVSPFTLMADWWYHDAPFSPWVLLGAPDMPDVARASAQDPAAALKAWDLKSDLEAGDMDYETALRIVHGRPTDVPQEVAETVASILGTFVGPMAPGRLATQPLTQAAQKGIASATGKSVAELGPLARGASHVAAGPGWAAFQVTQGSEDHLRDTAMWPAMIGITSAGGKLAQMLTRGMTPAVAQQAGIWKPAEAWAQARNLTQPPGMGNRAYMDEVLNQWARAGAPGAPSTFWTNVAQMRRKAPGIFLQGQSDALGFGALEGKVFGDLTDAFASAIETGDWGPVQKEYQHLVTSGLGFALLHAKNIDAVPRWKAEQHPDTVGFTGKREGVYDPEGSPAARAKIEAETREADVAAAKQKILEQPLPEQPPIHQHATFDGWTHNKAKNRYSLPAEKSLWFEVELDGVTIRPSKALGKQLRERIEEKENYEYRDVEELMTRNAILQRLNLYGIGKETTEPMTRLVEMPEGMPIMEVQAIGDRVRARPYKVKGAEWKDIDPNTIPRPALEGQADWKLSGDVARYILEEHPESAMTPTALTSREAIRFLRTVPEAADRGAAAGMALLRKGVLSEALEAAKGDPVKVGEVLRHFNRAVSGYMDPVLAEARMRNVVGLEARPDAQEAREVRPEGEEARLREEPVGRVREVDRPEAAQKEEARREEAPKLEIERFTGEPSRAAMGIVPRPSEAAQRAAEEVRETYGLAREVFSRWTEPLIERVARLAPTAEMGREIRERGYRAIDDARLLRADFLTNEVMEGMREISRMLGEPSKARRSLMEVEFAGKGGRSKFHRALEGEKVELSAPEQKIVDLYNDLLFRTGKEAEKRGAKMRGPSGEIAFTADPARRRFLRQPTHDLQEIIRKPDSKPYSDLVDWLMRENGLSRKKVEKGLGEIRDSIDFASGKRAAFEIKRRFTKFPDTLKSGGARLELLEGDPLRAIERMIETSATRLAMIKEFGTAIDSPFGDIGTLIREYSKGGRPDAEWEMKMLMRAMHGMSPDPRRMGGPQGLREITGMALRLRRRLLLPLAVIPNMVETVGHVRSDVGSSRWLQAGLYLAKELVKKKGSVYDLEREYVRAGEIMHHVWDRMIRPGHRWQSVFDLMGTPAKATELMNRINEIWAAESARRMRKDLEEGRGTDFDKMRLMRRDFTPEEANAMVEGRASPELMQRLTMHAAREAHGTGEAPLRSRAANTKWWNNLFIFESFFQNRARRVFPVVARTMQAMARPDQLTRAEARYLLGFNSGVMASGALPKMLRILLLSGGIEGLHQFFREFEDDPLKGGLKLWTESVIGGAAQITTDAVAEAAEHDAEYAIGEAVASTQAGAFLELANMIFRRGRYRDMELGEALDAFFWNQTALERPVRFLGSLVGLEDADPKTEAARSAYFRALREIKPGSVGGSWGSGEWSRARHHMRSIANLFNRGVELDDPRIAEHLRDAFEAKVEDTKDVEAAKKSLRQSILSRRLLFKGGEVSVAQLDDAQTQRLFTRLGEDNIRRLARVDRMLEVLADAID